MKIQISDINKAFLARILWKNEKDAWMILIEKLEEMEARLERLEGVWESKSG